MNPGITHSMTQATNLRDFLLYTDKDFLKYYTNTSDYMKSVLEFMYRTCYRFCLRDTQIMYILNGLKDRYEEELKSQKKLKEKEERKREDEEKQNKKEERKKKRELKKKENS